MEGMAKAAVKPMAMNALKPMAMDARNLMAMEARKPMAKKAWEPMALAEEKARAAVMVAAVAMLLAFTTAAPLSAQPIFEIEAGGGYTIVDVEAVGFAEGGFAEDWSQPSYRLAARALFNEGPGPRFGAEVGYQYLYWYQVRIPFGIQPIRREYDVTAVSAMGLLRLGGEAAVVDLGAGLAFLDDPVAVLSAAVGWEVADRVVVKLRADGMLAAEPTLPLGIAVSYAFGRSGG